MATLSCKKINNYCAYTNFKGTVPYYIIMQNDENLVIYTSNNATWASNTLLGKSIFKKKINLGGCVSVAKLLLRFCLKAVRLRFKAHEL
jgi:hypothetical protein